MKRFYLLTSFFLTVFVIYQTISKEIDVTKKPEPLPEKEFKFPDYQKVTFKNGLNVFIIEDHEQPTIAFRMLIKGGKSVDILKPGISNLTASILTKGAGGMNAYKIAQKLDGVGASISVKVNMDYITINASSLKKHLGLLTEMFANIILKPDFPSDEFEKLKPQLLASIQQEKGDPEALSAKMSRRVIYGENHPYALFPTAESIDDIDIDDLEDYYQKYFKPNNATLAVIGDVDAEKIVNDIKSAFSSWQKSKKPINISIPKAKPLPLGVYFIERPGSVQSSITVSYLTIPFAHKDYEKLKIATSIISGGIAGRLFKTLREKYSYTYTPYGFLTQGKYAGRYSCGADVRSSVTDSAIIITIEQLRQLSSELADNDELMRVKRYQTGNYQMSYENTGFIAGSIQNSDFFGIPIDRLESYSTRIMDFSAYNIKEVAEKYLNPRKAYFIVVGNAEVKDNLSQFGKIYDFDLNLKAKSGAKGKFESISLDAEELLEEYIDAIGGIEAIQNVETIIDSAHTVMTQNGRKTSGKLMQYSKAPNRKYFSFEMSSLKQEVWIDGENVWTKVMDKVEKENDENAEKYFFDAILFKHTNLLQLGYKCKVLGQQGKLILMKAIAPNGKENTYYFDSETFLINKIESTERTRQGIIPITEYIREYVEVDGVKLPKIIEASNPIYNMKTNNNYIINQPLEDSIFSPK